MQRITDSILRVISKMSNKTTIFKTKDDRVLGDLGRDGMLMKKHEFLNPKSNEELDFEWIFS